MVIILILIYYDFNIYDTLSKTVNTTSDNVINVSNGVSSVFYNDEFDLSYVGANGKTNDPLFDNIKESRLKYPKSLIIAHININSLEKENKAPIDYFRDILLNHYIDLLFVSETKLDEQVVEKDLNCSPDFKLYRKDRYTNSEGCVHGYGQTYHKEKCMKVYIVFSAKG